jgi:hypothetical protein
MSQERGKITQCQGVNVKLPLQIEAHLLLHLVDLPMCKHALSDNTPELVGVDDLYA